MTGRLAELDPLLALAVRPEDPDLVVGSARAWSRCDHPDPASAQASYGKLEQFFLSPDWDSTPAELDALIRRWRSEVLTAEPGPDSQASVLWPSRDVEAARVFIAHGLRPGAVIAVRVAGPVSPAESSVVRRAGPLDAASIATLSAQEIAYETGLSALTERPGHVEAVLKMLSEQLVRPEPWTWVAEVDGAVVGALRLQTPAEAEWISGRCALTPVAYLALLSVTASHRESGLGTALVQSALNQLATAGVDACLLHYGSANPLSVPFWSRRGFRPLWTAFETFPATTLR